MTTVVIYGDNPAAIKAKMQEARSADPSVHIQLRALSRYNPDTEHGAGVKVVVIGIAEPEEGDVLPEALIETPAPSGRRRNRK